MKSFRNDELLKRDERVLDASSARTGSPQTPLPGGPFVPASILPGSRVTQRAWVQVNLGAIARNTHQMRGILAPGSELLAVVKADAYGHGAAAVARVAAENGAGWLGVATIDEGVDLRAKGLDQPILVLGYSPGSSHIQNLIEAGLTPTVCSVEHARDLSRAVAEFAPSGAGPIPVHLKIDTGLHRLGQPWTEARELATAVAEHGRWLRATGIYSHLACADRVDPAELDLQHTRFETAIAELRAARVCPPIAHFANSAATLRSRRFHHDIVRVGLAIYGMYPAPHLAEHAHLEPALQVKARITQVKDIDTGAGVSYGHTYKAPRPRRIAVVSIGYADGVPCTLSNRLEVLLHGQRVQQIGRITMDQLMIDVSDCPQARHGDIVTLLGSDGDASITVMDWAERLDTIPWEVLCLFKSRLPRVAHST